MRRKSEKLSSYHLVFYWSTKVFNERWSACYQQLGDTVDPYNEVIVSEEMQGNGAWEISAEQLGTPKLSLYDDFIDHKLVVERKIVRAVRLALRKETGSNARQMLRVHTWGASLGSRLSATIVNYSNIAWRYQANDASRVRIEWAKAEDLQLTVEGGNAERFRQFYESRKLMRLFRVPEPESNILKNVGWQLLALDNKVIIHLGRPNAPRALALLSPPEAEDGLLAVSFTGSAFPIIYLRKPPKDLDWVNYLLCPLSGATLVEQYYRYAAGDYIARYQEPAQPSDSSRLEPLAVSPLAHILSAGGPEVLLESETGVGWALVAGYHGKVESKSGRTFYLPPAPSSSVVYTNPGETLIPAASKESLASPVDVDRVKASLGQRSEDVSFVACKVTPTHFIRVSQQGMDLRLRFCFVNIRGEEKEVSAENTSWQILAGNGVIDSRGIFSIATQEPTPHTIVMAVDKSKDDEWRWAVTVIPMPLFSSEDTERFFSD
ncbi:hypothetical protein [Pseudomonas sp. NPDC089396]|uniref:hypothetical protein n=1 Tax=Pseudomonas sp. NPDC089396 TaxID=3364461 RepID=UPI00383774C5